MKKKLIFIVLAALIAAFLLTDCAYYPKTELEFCEGTNIDYSKFEGTVLKVYNWGYYISDGSDGSIDVNKEFEMLTGIDIVYDNYDSNESLYAKIKNGGADYDVIIPSDYMIARLINEGYLAKLNFDNIPNYKYIDNKYKNMEYDINNEYSVPYNVGTVGVIYNKNAIPEKPTSWSVMWDEQYKGKILNFNNPRDAFAIAQFYLGLDINSTNEADWDAAYEALLDQKNVLQSYVMDEVFNKMESGEAWLAPYYAGDFFTMYENEGNDNLGFFYPEEGTNVFVDAACVLANSKNKEAAELYINFLADPVIAKANAEYLYYASPNEAVAADEEYIQGLLDTHPDAYEILYGYDNPKNDAFADLPDSTKKYMTKKWTQLGASVTEDNDNNIIYAVSVLIIAMFVGWFIFNTIRKKKRAQYYK
ncbi:MAG: spermidine/putrescine ABC transporter substrate-binding protein [Clostridia bacterium]|nr:spermidine/putrescine ABC transporter substrate-binding protein [Clostridia bacterium]